MKAFLRFLALVALSCACAYAQQGNQVIPAGGGSGVTSITGDGTLITNSGSTGAVTLTTAAISGTGNIAFTTSPVFTTPNLGTPTAVTLTNGTGYLLNNLAAAGGTATIGNGNNPIIWNWAQTTNSQSAMTFGETSAATNGTVTNNVANQAELAVSTASGSTAVPLSITQGPVTGTTIFPAMQISTTWNNAGINGNALLIKATDTSSGSSSTFVNFFDGVTSEFSITKLGTITFGNASQIQPGATVNITTSTGNAFIPIKTAGVTVSDGNSSSGIFGSSISYNSSACETNFGPTTLATGTTTTNTGLSCLPANAIIDGVVGRVTTTITGSCTGWEFGDGTTAARFTTNNTGLTAGSTAVVLSGSAWTTGIASATTGMYQQSAHAIVITCAGGNPAAGAIRVIVYYHTLTNPTS